MFLDVLLSIENSWNSWKFKIGLWIQRFYEILKKIYLGYLRCRMIKLFSHKTCLCLPDIKIRTPQNVLVQIVHHRTTTNMIHQQPLSLNKCKLYKISNRSLIILNGIGNYVMDKTLKRINYYIIGSLRYGIMSR